MNKVHFTVNLDRSFYHPGQVIEGHFICDPQKPINIDYVEGRLHGEVLFQSLKEHPCSSTHQTLVDESFELWRHCTLNELLGLDENQYPSTPHQQENRILNNPTTFPIRMQIPHFAPPTFQCPGSPVNVRFTLELKMMNGDEMIARHEEALMITARSMPNNLKKLEKDNSFNKTFHYSKGRSVFLEVLLNNVVFSTTGKIDACINVCNRWKQSLKYVHLNIVRKITSLKSDNSKIDTIGIDTTGVGLPSYKRKICVGESFSFRPQFNVPALPPNIHVNGVFKTEYVLKISIGRAHNFVISTFEIPIQIVTTQNIYQENGKNVLVDISSTSSNNNNNNNMKNNNNINNNLILF